MTGTITPEINELLRRQTTAGTEEQPELTDDEKKRLVQFYAQRDNEKQTKITPEINELLKRQANAGTPGNPQLTPEEQQKLGEFYSGQQ